MMKLGEWGNIALTAQVLGENGKFQTAPTATRKADRWRARAKVKDFDGRVRDVERYGPTKAAARRFLEEALRERVTPAPADSEIKPNTRLKEAAEVWRAEMLADERRETNTRRVYESTLNKHVIGTDCHPAPLAYLTVREVRVSGVERALRDVSKMNGPGAAEMTRSVLRGVLDLAVRHDAIPLNPVRLVGAVSAPSH